MPKFSEYSTSSPKYSYWELKTFFKSFDYIVIGGGIVGLSTAIEVKLKKPTSSLLLLEKGMLPSGASTKNAGFACFGSVTELLDDLSLMNTDTVWQTVKMRYDGLELLRKRVGDKAMDYKNYGGLEWFDKKQDYDFCLDKLQALNKNMREVLHLKNVYTKSKTFYGSKIVGCIKNNFEGQLDTAAMMRELYLIALKSGVVFLNGVDVKKIVDEKSKAIVATNLCDFETKKVIVATNGFAKELLKIKDVLPARAQVLITKPIKNLKLKGAFHFNKGYNYFRNIDNRILLGGGRNIDMENETSSAFELNTKIQNYLSKFLNEVVSPNQKVEVAHRWCGIMGVGKEKKPIIEFVSNNVIAAVRMGGMGVAIGSMVGKIAAEKVVRGS